VFCVRVAKMLPIAFVCVGVCVLQFGGRGWQAGAEGEWQQDPLLELAYY